MIIVIIINQVKQSVMAAFLFICRLNLDAREIETAFITFG